MVCVVCFLPYSVLSWSACGSVRRGVRLCVCVCVFYQDGPLYEAQLRLESVSVCVHFHVYDCVYLLLQG